jgi:transmembrane sensor
MSLSNFNSQSKVDAEAVEWLARRDRGLTPAEQDEYLQWLREDERRAAAIGRAEATMRRLLQLSAWRHENSAEPNPDLLASPRRSRAWRGVALAAAAVALGVGGSLVWFAPVKRAPAVAVTKNYLHVNEQIALPDGSRAELRDGSTLDVRFTAGERRVRLTGGEAQFSVLKDVARPFVVEAGGVAVRAIGTVFDVQLGSAAVEVLVTEGKVRVGRAGTQAGEIFQTLAAGSEPPLVAAGERAVVSLTDLTPAPSVAEVSSEEIRRRLDWQAPRLKFDETALTEVVAEFNRRNRHQLVLGDNAVGAERIGGSFRPDNVEAFVRLLAITNRVRAEARGENETVLRSGR